MEQIMARTPRSPIEARTNRLKLPSARKPVFVGLGEGIGLGYRRNVKGAGAWVMRRSDGKGGNTIKNIGVADDFQDADNEAVLSYQQAVARCLAAAGSPEILEAARTTVRRRDAYTVSVALDDYLAHLEHEGRSKGALDDARNRIEALIAPELGAVPVDELKADHIRKWMDKLAASPPRRRGKPDHQPLDEDGKRKRRDSVNRSLTTLKAALNHAFREARTSSDAEWKRVQAFRGVVGNRTGWLPIDRVRKLISACPDDFGHLVRAAILTGARYGELCRMTVGDFQPDNGTLFIAQSKSGKARYINLNTDARAFFTSITKERAQAETMLQRADATAWEHHHQIRRMADACAKAGIEPAISFHELRHTWASLSIMNGMPLQVAAQMLGHSDTRMVEKHYGHLSRTFVADQVEAFAPRLEVV